MTTIAFDGKTFASDKRQCVGNTPTIVTKIWPTPKNKRWKAIGAAGNAYLVNPVVDYIRGVSKKEPDQFDEVGNILLIDKKNKLWIMNGRQTPVEAPIPFAIGSGGDYAIGAMAAGKTAAEAVAIAATLDVNTGGGIDEIAIA